MRWTVIYEQDPDTGGWGARVADLPVFVCADTRSEAERLVREAIAFHLKGLRADGLPVPEPRSVVGVVEVALQPAS
jgi:predicted RNase H-like HicB family nuclease